MNCKVDVKLDISRMRRRDDMEDGGNWDGIMKKEENQGEATRLVKQITISSS